MSELHDKAQAVPVRRMSLRLRDVSPILMSRAEGKRILRRLHEIDDLVLDFEGVDLVGQGFADGVFRVWARAHPETHFVPVNTSDPVRFMVERAIRRAEGD